MGVVPAGMPTAGRQPAIQTGKLGYTPTTSPTVDQAHTGGFCRAQSASRGVRGNPTAGKDGSSTGTGV